MAEVKFAEVVYLTDKVRKIVPIAFIRYHKKDICAINPKDEKDFESDHTYHVRWYHCGVNGSKCEKSHTHDYNTYKAKIFHFGG